MRLSAVIAVIVFAVISIALMLYVKSDVHTLYARSAELIQTQRRLKEDWRVLQAEYAMLSRPQRLWEFGVSEGLVEIDPRQMWAVTGADILKAQVVTLSAQAVDPAAFSSLAQSSGAARHGEVAASSSEHVSGTAAPAVAGAEQAAAGAAPRGGDDPIAAWLAQEQAAVASSPTPVHARRAADIGARAVDMSAVAGGAQTPHAEHSSAIKQASTSAY